MSADPFLLFFGALGFLFLGVALIVRELLSSREEGQAGLNLSIFYYIQIASSIIIGLTFLGFFIARM